MCHYLCHCYLMKRETTESNQTGGQRRQSHGPTFAKVIDGRKQPIRGLWVRNGRYYARLNVENPVTGIKKTRRVPLVDKDNNPVQTVPQAVAELKRLQTHRADNTLRTVERTDRFADYAKHYLEVAALGKPGEGPTKASTREKQKTILGRWTDSIGQLRLDQIKRVHVNRFIESRLKELDRAGNPKVCARTINLDVIGLRVVLKRALSDGLIQRLPTEGLRPLKTSTPKRSLFTSADLDKLCAAAFQTKTKADEAGKQVQVPVTENAQEFTDYVKLMAYSGCRRNEALGLKWDDVDFDNGQLHVLRQVTSRGIEDLKNRETRTVDFNPKLRAHLEAMDTRKAPDSKWLFPSPQRGDKDIPAKTFRESLDMVRTQANLPGFRLHDLRHHFISMAVMSGVDFMTIAAWVGHKDGGVLIGKVYGHLANEHRKAMAEKLSFGPVILSQVAGA
jgi:integrase